MPASRKYDARNLVILNLLYRQFVKNSKQYSYYIDEPAKAQRIILYFVNGIHREIYFT